MDGEKKKYVPSDPMTLPLPEGTLNWSELVEDLGKANRALARYAGLLYAMETPRLLLSPFFRDEAVRSNRIEGTRVDTVTVLRSEAGDAARDESEKHDLREVFNYREAMDYAVSELERRPMSPDFLKGLHCVLLDSVRGEDKSPGKFRELQNYIGSELGGIENARFIPPDPLCVPALMDNWTAYLASPESFPSENDRRLYAQGLYTLLAGNTAEQARNMSRDERRAVWGYTVYSGDINPALRGERVEKPFKDLLVFQDAMRKTEFPMAKVAHRSASLAEIKNRFGGELSELASGDEANYPNALSMSGFKKFASSPEVQMIVEIPKGAHAIYLDPLSEKGPFKRSGKSWDGNPRAPQTLWQSDSEANTESEILAAPGTKLKVVSVDAENKILCVRIEL